MFTYLHCSHLINKEKMEKDKATHPKSSWLLWTRLSLTPKFQCCRSILFSSKTVLGQFWTPSSGGLLLAVILNCYSGEVYGSGVTAALCVALGHAFSGNGKSDIQVAFVTVDSPLPGTRCDLTFARKIKRFTFTP